MGVAIFFGLVFIALGIVVVVLYGVFVGVLSLIRLYQRQTVSSVAPGVLASSSGQGGVGVAVLGAPRTPAPRGLHKEFRPAPPEARCWEVKQCPVADRDACPAYKRPQAPCWLACMQAEEALRPECMACKHFNLPMFVMQA